MIYYPNMSECLICSANVLGKMFKFGLGLVLTLLPIVGASVNLCIYPGTSLNFIELLKKLNTIKDFLNNDTYVIEKFPLDFSHPAISLYGAFSNVNISNIKDNIYEPFDLSKLKLHQEIQLLSVTFNNLTLNGDYDVTGDIGKLFSIFGTGPFEYSLYNFNINVTGYMTVGNGTCINTNVDVTLGGTKGHFYNFMNDDELELLLNDVIGSILVDVIEMIWEDEKEWNDKIWEEDLNKRINGNNTLGALWSVSRSTS